MKSLVSRLSLLGALVTFGCASLPAQDPYPARTVAYSTEELDNLVAPVALYPDALLAQILVAATFPDQIALASQYVRERGTRNIEDQGWDISVKAVAYYPPVLNMLARDEDWTVALGQAYASQSGDVMDAVQRLREMAREQGNLVSTREHTVTEDRGRIVIVPANPEVIYVPTYDPAIVYVRPIFSFGFHTGYFSFGLGFPIGSWLVYEPDWWGHYGHRVYYHGWYGDGWRYYARRHFTVYPVYYRPRYSVVNININIFSRRVNYINLDRRHRYVRRSVAFERHYSRDRYADRDRDRNAWRDDDRRGPISRGGDYDGTRDDGRGTRDRNDGNDRVGDRIATFDDFRPDRGGTGSDARDAEPIVTRSGFSGGGGGDKQKENGSIRANGGADSRGRPDIPVYTSMPRSNETKSRANGSGNGNSQAQSRRPDVPVFTSQPRASDRTSTGGGQAIERKSNGGNSGGQSEYRGGRPNAPDFSAPQRSTERKSSNGGRTQEYRSAPRPSAPVYSAPQRSVERKSGGGGGGGGGGATFSRPSGSARVQSSGGGGGSARVQSGGGGGGSARVQSGGGGGGGKVKASSGGSGSKGGGGGKGRKQ